MTLKSVFGLMVWLVLEILITACQTSSLPYVAVAPPSPSYELLQQDVIIQSDLWTDQPEILAANYAFENIVGVAGGEPEVRAAGGTWNTVSCPDPPRRTLTSSSQPNEVAFAFGYPVQFADAMPVVFSWPVLPSTVGASDFVLTLNTGERIQPEVASIYPNVEYNERHVVVLFGQFGNRLTPDTPGAVYPVQLEIIQDNSPLQLVGSNGVVSAVGLTQSMATHPYVTGPSVVAAKLSRLSPLGEGAPALFSAQLPNDGLTLYGDEAQFRLRLFTSGGFSPDGVQGVHPDEFARFFRLHVDDGNGGTILLTEAGVNYAVPDGVIRILGLADLGPPQTNYDDCYLEDYDNYIDIILNGDVSAMRHILHVEIPASGGYAPFFNPGGPGNRPTSGVHYTAPGLAQLQPVTLAIEDPLTVSYGSR
ncbi:MAG: hypothetical protein OHK0012_01830 [Synechococcales cyanobacterium]